MSDYPTVVTDTGELAPAEDWSRLEDDELPDLSACDGRPGPYDFSDQWEDV